MAFRKVTDSILYVGVNDHEVDLFEGQYVVPNGMAYNSYVILDDKIAVMDTVDIHFAQEWLNNIAEALDGKKPTYLVVQHMEPDHSASIAEFLKVYPDAIPDKHKRISELIQRKYNLKIKKYTSGRKIAKDYGQKIFELMNEAYSPLYGYSPLTQRQIDQYVKMYLPILDLRMVTLITDANDELVCVGISMPSLAEALQKSNGRLLPLGWFYLLKALFMKRRAKMLDLLLVAVKPEYQNKGVNALLFSDLIPVYQKLGFIFAESNPELELNGKVQAQWDYFETQQHKRRRAFIKEIK